MAKIDRPTVQQIHEGFSNSALPLPYALAGDTHTCDACGTVITIPPMKTVRVG